jgi:hypothetical protein
MTASDRQEPTKIVAWNFRTDLTWLGPLKQRLDAISRAPWTEFDSDSKQDSIGSKITDHAWLRIYMYGKGYFVANLTVQAPPDELERELELGKQRVFSELLPAVGARDVGETTPVE